MDFKFEWKGEQVKADVKKAGDRGLLMGAEFLLAEASKIVPHDQGMLEDDGEALSGNGAAAVNYNMEKAPRLHEHPEYDFQNNREGKWLEKTFNEHGDEAMEIVANELRGELGG